MENLAMKRNLKYFIRYGLAAGLLVALAVILSACSSAPSTVPTISTPPSSQAPAAAATSPATTQKPAPPTIMPNLNQRQGVAGTLSNINGNTLTLTSQQGTVTVNVSSTTTIQKTVNGTVSDLQVGQSLSVTGSQDAGGNLTAASISIQPQNQGFPTPPAGTNPIPSGRPRPSGSASPRMPDGGGGRGAFGTLSSINGNTLTLTGPQGSVTVNITSNTTIQKSVTGTISDLRNGQSLNVMGSRDASGNVNATSIAIRPQGASPSPTGT